MARETAIRRLHQFPKISEFQEPELERVKLPNLGNSQPEPEGLKSAIVADSQTNASTLPAERRVRGRFVLPRAGEQTYTLDANAIMAMVEPGAPMDRGPEFQALAMREQVLKFARSRLRAGQRGGAGFRPGPGIQAIQV
jgi:hypothetical protein